MAHTPLDPVSVVIPTIGRLQLLEETLPILLADDATHEVILVLDGDSATEQVIELERQHPRVRVEVLGPEPRLVGEQAGRDLGAALAEAEIVLCLDDDVIPGPGLVSGHSARHRDSDKLVVLGYMPVVVPDPVGKERVYRDSYEYACRRYEERPDEVIRNLWGGNFSVRRRHWLQAIERERVPIEYHEDRELGLVLMELGLHGVFARELRAEHRYRREAAAAVRDARASAIDQLRLHDAYPSVVQPPRRSRHLSIRAVAHAMRRRRAERLVRGMLLTTIRLAGAAGAGQSEELLVKLLWRLTFDRTLESALRPSRRNASRRLSCRSRS